MARLGSSAKAVLRACAWMVALVSSCCLGQQQQSPVFTLKVYADIIQVPTLVLDSDREPLRRLDPSRFRVSLDGGKKFAPARVRVEGEDPLDVAILLDMSGSQRHFISTFAKEAAKLAGSLHPQDRISVYAMNCQLVRSARQVIPDANVISSSIDAALSAPALNAGYEHGACPRQVSLWNVMMMVVHDMSDSPARRVMLVVSEGDVRQFVGWGNLHRYAADHDVALFGLNDGFAYSYDPLRREVDDPLRNLCEATGGVVMHSPPRNIEKRLTEWVTMLRDRYVVEFPRPQRLVEGMHEMKVSVKGDPLAFVTIAGVGVSLPDPSLTNDPHYLPSQEGSDIPVGTRRPNEH